ncbi:MAG TPA: hypothetical protein EYG88_13745 [Desulfocapsa sulfexigens]|nr:hypothetical protein [Desulfocapsa sulfexigens]
MISTLYTNLPHDTGQRLQMAIDRGLTNGTGTSQVFFRADDIGVPGKQFSRLIRLFCDNNLPLCLAVVPTWLTDTRFQSLQNLTGQSTAQWCWHQHGWLHKNHETSGKKQEFGPGRSGAEQLRDLKNGKKRLTKIMGKSFAPYFTPPWNRCSMETLQGLQALRFKAVSRSLKATPPAPPALPDLHINIDLHTRKEKDPEIALKALLKELELGMQSGQSGIMIHHQRMNQPAFDFLSLLLQIIASHQRLSPVRFQEIPCNT